MNRMQRASRNGQCSLPLRSVAALALGALFLAACGGGLRPLPKSAPVPVATPAGNVPATPTVAAADATATGMEAWIAELAARRLMVPVEGLSAKGVRDTFAAARSGGRTHRAIDFMAPRGTPVLSADDGRVLRLSRNTLGGITIYAIDSSERFVYYYAHLDGYRDGLEKGARLTRGELLGYVGTTGNAPENVPHLHFQVMRWPDDGAYWNGIALDPLPFFAEPGQRQR